MKYSKLWLQELTNLNLDTTKLSEQLTMLGLEVSSVEMVAPKFHGVVIGEVIRVTKHPNADKLAICTVKIGVNENIEIVCGAPNVKPKLKVPVALIGAELPNNIKIKKFKLRGMDSFGMLCSAAELGLAINSSGILELSEDAPIGCNIRDYLFLDDEILNIDLTFNRGDCLSMLGMAREIAVINRVELTQHSNSITKFTSDKEPFSVEVLAEDSCPHYIGRIIRGVNNKISTPSWMRERLRRLGLNSINLIVDVTNYVMIELGQPLHAFDMATIDGCIKVRYAKNGESIDLLDGRQLKLIDTTLVIADDTKLLAVGGIMGGNYTKVSFKTTDIFLESAFFVPEKIAITSRIYNLSTDASYRYERGVDYKLQLSALERATSLIITIAGGIPETRVELISQKYLPRFSDIFLRRHSVHDIIGITIPDRVIEDILIYLGTSIQSNVDGWLVSIPSFRFDLKIEEDLVEEISRIYGYNSIPEQEIVTSLQNSNIDTNSTKFKRRLLDLVEDLGYHEIITYSFVDEKLQSMLNNNDLPLFLINPLSKEQNVLRSTLWPGLLNVVKYNFERQKRMSRFFEIGLKFSQKNSKIEQTPAIAGAIYGTRYPEQWGVSHSKLVDFFDIKNDVEKILNFFSYKNVRYLPVTHMSLHPKCSAEIRDSDNNVIGLIGKIHPIIAQYININTNVYLFEINLRNIFKESKHTFQVFSKFPSVSRDIAIVVKKEIEWIEIKNKIISISAGLLQNIILFDIYSSENIGLDKRSMAIRIIFQSIDHTLVDSEVDLIINQIILVLRQDFDASLRG
ncbi:MAG: phenylalanine--tRNA ligase subunit beta [Coxiellaceae bacterium]|jgi:phenylalanyl-tRNA synthetase beta chain|nr:phenylalanine--tRNA ligase subunit beta [Coxiellaceae bacterium]